MNRSHLCLLATFALIGISENAYAQRRAGAAMAPTGSAPDTGKVNACSRACTNQAMACAKAAGRTGRPTQADVNRCTAQALACEKQCVPASSGSDSDSARSTAPQITPATTDSDADSSAPEAEADAPDPEAAFDQLLQSWQQANNRRLVNADRRALQLTRDILQVLCHQLNLKECTNGAPDVALPEPPSNHRPSSNRWSTRTSVNPAAPKATTKLTPKKPKGCYLKGQFLVVGVWGSDALYINTSLIAAFTTASSSDLEVQNLGDQPAWVGIDLALNNEVPPHSTKHLSVPMYRTKDDTRASRATLSAKYWTETDEKKCSGGGEAPGFTTPEEWPQAQVDERLHTIE